MSNIDKQALRSTSDRDWFDDWFKREFHPDKTGPYIKDQLFFAVLAARAPLLDELEVAEKRIAELGAREFVVNIKPPVIGRAYSALNRVWTEQEVRTACELTGIKLHIAAAGKGEAS
ncbi:hypothetical protein N6A11_000701 [Klebsiella oxytoca]|nr:hypothetical protein [Klebsiella oxytoca]